MSGAAENRDSENNWVITNNEGLPVETLGASQTATHQAQPEEESTASDTGRDQGATETDGSAVSRGSEETLPPAPQPAATPTKEEQLFIPPEVPEIPAPELEPLHPKPSLELPRKVDEELEEVSCSSSEEDVEGLRKRAVWGAASVNVGPTVARETIEQETEMSFSLTLNKCIIAAVALIALGFLLFSGSGMMTEEDPYENVHLRSVSGGDTQAIVAIQEWMKQHAGDFTGDPGNLHVMNSLLDKVAKENQEIRLLQATLQAQKEELEVMLNVSEGETATATPPHYDLKQENVRLKEALLKEETAHLSAQEELQALKEKMEAMEGSTVGKEALTSENTKLKAELDSSLHQIIGFLSQKETLVAESQMLRQELDKQRLLVTSIRRDLENLNTQFAEPEDEQQLHAKVSDMSSRLALEVQRSETWEKKYVEHAQKRKQQIKEERRDHGHKDWKKGEKIRRPETSNGEFIKPAQTSKHWRDQGKDSQHEEWKKKKYEQQEDRREEKKYRPWEKEQRGKERDQNRHQYETSERVWKEKHQHHEETGGNFHPRKGQRDYKSQKEEENSQRKGQEGQTHGKDSHHRHHDHNKFWKKLSDHQYRIPEGCSGVEECARKDGMDLFNVELKPVQRKQLEEVLHSYLAKVELSKTLPELLPLLDGFFDGPIFSHHKIRFRDFVDDMEDFLEDLARRETGDDDIVDDFERYVYTSFFGDAALSKKRLAAKDQKKNHSETKNSPKPHNQGQERRNGEHKQRPPKSAYPEGEEHAHHNHKYHKDKSHGELFQKYKYKAGEAHYGENEESNYPHGYKGHGASSDEGHFHKYKPHNEKQMNPDYKYKHKDYPHGEEWRHEHGKKHSKEKYPQGGDRQVWGHSKDYDHKDQPYQHKKYHQTHYEKHGKQAHQHPQSHKPWKEHAPPAQYYSKEEWSGHRHEDPTRNPKWAKDGQYHDKHHKEKHHHHWEEEKKYNRER